MEPVEDSFRKKIRHPPCISYLLHHGVPSDVGFEKALSLLVKYILTKGLSDVQGTKMARTITLHASLGTESQCHLEAFSKKIAHARNDPRANYWRCHEIWQSQQLRESGACTGWSCEYYLAERYDKTMQPPGGADDRSESEILSYVFDRPDSASGDGLTLGLRSEAFFTEYVCRDGTRLLLNRVVWHVCWYLIYHNRPISFSSIVALLSRVPVLRPHADEIERYVQQLRREPTCRHARFVEHLKIVRDRGGRLRARDFLRQAEIALESNSLPLEIIAKTLERQLRMLPRAECDTEQPFANDLNHFVTNLFSTKSHSVPTPSQWLNAVLGGGWKTGSLYEVFATSAAEATDFGAWCAEYASLRRFPALFISYGTSKEELIERALARHSNVNVLELSRYRRNTIDVGADVTTLNEIVEAAERLNERTARNVTIVEGNPETTAEDVKNAVRRIQKRLVPDHDRPMLVVLDQLPSSHLGSRKRVSSVRNSLANNLSLEANLKQIPGLVTVAIPLVLRRAEADQMPYEKDESLKKPVQINVERTIFADCTLRLKSNPISVRGATSEKKVHQLDLAREWYKKHFSAKQKSIDHFFDRVEQEHPFDETADTYVRISLFGKGDEALANPVVIFERAHHRFVTLDVEPMW